MTKVTTTMLLFTLALAAGGCGSQPQVTPTLAPASQPTPTPTPGVTALLPAYSTGLTPTSQPMPTRTPRLAVEGRTATFEIIPGETTASYSVNQVILSENNQITTVVGQTGQVEGVFTLNYDQPLASQFGLFAVNLNTLTSGQPERDEAIREQWLESDYYPLATFVVKEIRNLPKSPRAGEPVRFQLVGDMTIKEVTRKVSWDVDAILKIDRLAGTATTSIKLAEFDVSPPSVSGVFSATITLNFTFKRVTPIPLPSSC